MSSQRRTSGYAKIRLRVQKRLCHYPMLIGLVRALRAIWIFGPWRNLLIRYHQEFSKNRPLPRNQQTLFDNLNVSAVVKALKQGGVAPGLRVPQSRAKDILNFCAQHQNASHSNPHLVCEPIRLIAHDPKIIEIARQYLGVEPILYQTSLYWSLPSNTEKRQRPRAWQKAHFHYDIGDFRSLVLFIYLTDVDQESGPHVVIEGTHQKKSFRQMLTRYLDNNTAYRQYAERIRIIYGTSGEGFFEDLACYHKRSTGTKKRLMLTISYMLQRTPLTVDATTSLPSNLEETIAQLVQTS